MVTNTEDKEDKLEVQVNEDGTATVVGAESSEESAAGKAEQGGEENTEISERGAKTEQEDPLSLEQELASAGTEEDREAIRARRRAERAERRQRRKENEDSLRMQLTETHRMMNSMAQEIALMKRRSAGTELAALDNDILTAQNTVTELKSIIADATQQQQGDIVADATDRMTKENLRLENLARIRNAFVNSARKAPATAPAPQPVQMDPAMMNHGMNWMNGNKWYNPQGGDLDSRIVRQIDDVILAEGYDPRTPDYWEELDERVAKHLPHRARGKVASEQGTRQNGADSAQKPRRSAVAGSGRESTAQSGSSSYQLSAERVQALRDAGMWDDPKLRNKMILRYQEVDRAAKASK